MFCKSAKALPEWSRKVLSFRQVLKLNTSLRVKGNSMSPLILDGHIIAVDTSQVSRDPLVGKIVVAWNSENKGLVVSRLARFDHTEAPVSDQRDNQPVLLANGSPWRIVGKVLWWTGKAQ
jgi:phage repressor protein C with HTH and peptisase S24 domain